MDEPISAYACGFTDDDSGGIFSYELDGSSGRLTPAGRLAATGVAFLAPAPKGDSLYAVSRVDGGQVSALRVDDETSELTELNCQSSGGEAPAYVSLDTEGRYAFVANAGGTVAALPIESDGRLGEPAAVVEHEGSSVHPDSQTAPHPHSIVPGPNDRFVYVPDLGTDTIEIYEFDYNAGALRPADSSPTRLRDGAGPRHMAFHPAGQVAYVINELDSTVTAFDYDPTTGALSEIETVGTLPDGFDGDNLCAEVQVHPSGEWLYGTNRGHDSVVVMSIDEGTGRLDVRGHESTRGEWPRHFAVDPSGHYLFVENRHSDSIVGFRIDEATGELTPTGHTQRLPEPICLRFA